MSHDGTEGDPKRRSRRALGGFFIAAGTMHFVTPKTYESIMPESLPMHREAVLVSGVAEIAGGLAALNRSPASQRFARWWLLALLAAVYPANVQMALRPERYPKIPPALLWARLPLQFACAAWVWRATEPGQPNQPEISSQK